MHFSKPTRYNPLIAIGLWLATVFSAHAATFTWDGGGSDSNWTTANNWNPNAAPSISGSNDIVLAGTTRLTDNVDGGTWTINSLSFSSGAGAFSLSGGGLTIGAGGITNSSTNTQTVGNQIQLTANQTWNASSGAIAMTNSYLDGNNKTLTVNGSSAVTVTGGQFNNLNTLTLTGSGNRSFATLNNAGTVNVQSTGGNSFSGQVGATTLNLSAGTTTFNNTGGTDAQIGSGGINISGTANATFNNSVGASGGINITSSGNINFAGAISGASLTLNGTGTTTLSGSGSKNITSTVVNSGTLLMNQSGGAAINGTLTVNSGGTVQFGANNQVPSWQTVTLNAGSTLLVDNTTQTFTNLVITGDSVIDFGGSGSTLAINSITVTNNALLTIVNWNSAVDTFTSSSNASSQAVQVYYADTGTTGTYTSGSGTITPSSPVPEPATYGVLLMGSSVAFVAWLRRRRALRV